MIVPVKVTTPTNNIFEFESIAEACRILHLRPRSVSKVLHGELKTHRNHKIEYI